MNRKHSSKNFLLRLLAAALSVSLLLSLAACGKSKDSDKDSEKDSRQTTDETSETSSDGQSGNTDDKNSAELSSGGQIRLVVSKVEGKPGETVTLKVSVEDNPGLHGYSFCLSYDKNVFSAAEGKITMEDNAFSVISDVNNEYGMNYQWTSLTPFTGNGEICELTLTIAEDAAPGSYPVEVVLRKDLDVFYQMEQVETEDGIDVLEHDVSSTAVNGSVTVTG